MTPEEKAKAYAERTYMYGIQRAIAKAAHLAGQQEAWQWIPITPETIPEDFVDINFYDKSGNVFYGYYHSGIFYEVKFKYQFPADQITHFRYIPQDKPKNI